MALNPSVSYAGQIDTTDLAGYPYGKAKNVTAIGDGTGTPLERLWVADLFGLEQSLLSYAGITPSGTPDKVGASQYLAALTILSDARSRSALLTSQALNWPERASVNDSSTLNADLAIAFAPNAGYNSGSLLVVQTSGTRVYTSEDGNLLTDRGTISAAAFSNPSVASGLISGVPGLIATAAAPSAMYRSADGITWTFATPSGVPAHGVVVYAPGRGWSILGDTGAALSIDGISWTAFSVPSAWNAGAAGGVKRLVWNGSLFVALPLASYNKCLTSPDGSTWTERTLPFTATWSGLAFSAADGMWMATSSTTGPVATSTDGITWTTATAANYGVVNDLACIGNVWVGPTVLGNFGGLVWSNDKGANWNRLAVGNHRVATAGWKRIIAGDNRFIVAHATGLSIELALSARTV